MQDESVMARENLIDPILAVKTTQPSPSRRSEIRTLQYGRGIAALLVCLFHTYGAIEKYFGVMPGGRIFNAGHSGVEFFFVLSGFIIFTAHRRDFGQPSRLGTFYRKRAIRVLPMFWLVVVPLGALFLFVPSLGADRALTFFKYITDLLLIPRSGLLTLAPAWTLQHEVIFYLVFGLVLYNIKVGFAALGLWQGACFITLIFGLTPQDYMLPINKFFGFYNFGFIFGIAVAMLSQSRYFGKMRPVLLGLSVPALLALITLFIGEARGGSSVLGSSARLTLSYFTIYSSIMLALLIIPNKPRPLLDSTLGVLGGASYVLYLIHEPMTSVVTKILLAPALKPFARPEIAYSIMIIISIVSALFLHHYVERPILGFLNQRLRSSRNPLNQQENSPIVSQSLPV